MVVKNGDDKGQSTTSVTDVFVTCMMLVKKSPFPKIMCEAGRLEAYTPLVLLQLEPSTW